MKTIVVFIAWLLLAAGVQAAGFSHLVQLDANGIAQVALGGGNIWKPVSIALLFENEGERTVGISRHTEGISYQIASVTGSGKTYVYLFEGIFWFRGTNVLRIAVEPPTPGIVEVIGE
jgi:hypothetical protein